MSYVRGLVRPLVTVLLVGAAIGFVAVQMPVPEWFQQLVTVVVAFWFASRLAPKSAE